MRGLVVKEKGKVELVNDIPEPQIGPYDALVEVIACGICNGTDLKLIDGHFKGYDAYPCVLGHEPLGRVIKLGEKVTSYKIGDHVLRAMLNDTPKYYSGWGSFAERAFVSDYAAMERDGIANIFEGHKAQQVVPQDIDPNKALMLITLKEVFSGLKRFGVREGVSVMINGCGPVGLSMIRFCKILGVDNLIVSDIHDARLEKARELGADITVNPSKEDVASAVRDIHKDGLDMFIDAVGRNELINLGLRLVKFNGKVAVYGISPQCHADIVWEDAPYNWNIHFVQWPTFSDEASVHNQVVELVRSGAVNLDDFVTHVLPVEEFEKGFDLVKSKQGMKVSLTF